MNLLLEALKSFEEIPQNIEVEVLEITDSDLPEIVATNFVIPSVPSNSTESGNLGTSKFMSLINDPSILVIDKAWLCVGVLKYQEFVERDGFAAAATSMLLLADASIDANNKAMLCLGLLKYPAFVPLHGSAAAAVATPLLSNSSVDKINKAHLCYLILHYSILAPYHNAAAAASMPLLIDYSINNVIKKNIKNLLKNYIKKIKVK
jgi:hypothetical protein